MISKRQKKRIVGALNKIPTITYFVTLLSLLVFLFISIDEAGLHDYFNWNINNLLDIDSRISFFAFNDIYVIAILGLTYFIFGPNQLKWMMVPIILVNILSIYIQIGYYLHGV